MSPIGRGSAHAPSLRDVMAAARMSRGVAVHVFVIAVRDGAALAPNKWGGRRDGRTVRHGVTCKDGRVYMGQHY